MNQDNTSLQSFAVFNLGLVASLFIAISLSPVLGETERSNSNVYAEKLQQKFLSEFFPPKGDWAFSDGCVEGTLLQNGRIENVRVIQHLSNKKKPSLFGDSALYGAIVRSSPVEPPPHTISTPVKIIVRFIVKSKEFGGYRCVVKIAP